MAAALVAFVAVVVADGTSVSVSVNVFEFVFADKEQKRSTSFNNGNTLAHQQLSHSLVLNRLAL